MAAKIFRINYKSDFILTLNSDAGWMTPFCIKFWTGAPSQAYFAGLDGATYTHCTYDPSEPTKLVVQFDDHHLPIGELKFQIAYHFTVADFPNDTEDEVINPANITTEIDGQKYQVMLDFTGETAPEIQFSLPAYANEAQRIANEQQRIAAETQRIANEETRIANEQTRINQEQTRQQNEQQRINQEQARVNEYASLKADAVAATGAANDAAALANQKAQLAADKAALAQSAAQLANDKAQLAADKAALAQAASQLCDEKAALAQQKATYAQQQGDYSKAQGDYAKEQGDYSKEQGDYSKEQGDYSKEQGDYAKDKGDICAEDHQTAVADHQTAVADHQTAVADHQTAVADHQTAQSDHGIAADDHTQAGNDHTRAESDHTRAESDHAAVEVYVDSLGVFDLSKHNAVGGVLATYADLSAALTALNALDSKYKYGGMSFKFVQSSDNKYLQFMYKLEYANTTAGNTAFVNTANWEKINLEDEVSRLGQFVNSKEFLLNRNENNLFAQNYSGFTNYKSINNNGVVIDSTNANAIVSGFINVNPNNIYLYTGTTIDGTSPNVACYDENDNYIYGFKYSYSSTPTPNYIILPRNTKKVRIAYYAVRTMEFLEYSSSTNFAFQDYLEIRKNLCNRGIPSNVVDICNSTSWNNSKQINALTGAIENYTTTNNNQQVSDEIEINPTSVYIYYGFTIVAGLANYALYDSSHNFISSGKQVGSSRMKHIIYPPANAKYIRVSYYARKYDDYLKEISFVTDESNAEITRVDALKNAYSIDYIFDEFNTSTYSVLTGGKQLTSNGIEDITNQAFKATSYIPIDRTKIYHYRGTTADDRYRHILSFDEDNNVVDSLWFQNNDDFDIKFSAKAVKFVAGFYNPHIPLYNIPQFRQCLYTVSINKESNNYKTTERLDNSIETLSRINHWKGKVMCAFGASGTYGATDISFPIEVGKILDCTVRNFAKYSGSTRYYDTAMDENGVPTRAGLSTTLAEYAALGSTATIANCWENAFTTDLDLVIFGEGDSNCPSGDELIDLIQLPTQNNKHYTYSNGDTLAQHRNSYIGALVYLLDKLWGINPACRVIFTNDYLNIDGYSAGSGSRNRTKSLCEKLCLPNIQIWQKLGWSWYNQHIYMSHTSNPNDTVHPNELGTLKVAQIYANELLLIS